VLTRVHNATELRQVWRNVVSALSRDLSFAADLARDPIGTLRAQGYDVQGEAAVVLRRALP